MKKKIVVQIPCLNEEKGIANVIKQIKKITPKSRIIVYDNGSKDQSVQIAKKKWCRSEVYKQKG